MGMYTELNLSVQITKEAPEFVIKTLSAMIEGNDLPPETADILTGRISWMFGSSSYYLHPVSVKSFEYDTISEQWMLHVLFNIKNYEQEIERFIVWLTPFIDADTGDFLGYSRYEETEVPTLLYHPNNWFTPLVPFVVQ